MTELATCNIEDGIGLLTIDSPPVNALSATVRKAICDGFERFAQDESVSAIVLACAGRTFFAGADISEFGKPPQRPTLHDVLNTIEASTKPVVAAIHGTALGGGLELALVCHYRVATASARLGLPEVKLGILPGAGGTQRLTRLVGAERTLDLITSGRHASASEMLDWGVVDALADGAELSRAAVAFAKQVLREGRPLQRVRDRIDRVLSDRGKPELFASFRTKNARTFRGFMAPARIIECVEAAVELPFDEGMARERAAFLELVAGTQSAAQRYAFFAEREAAKAPDIAPDTPTLAINRVGVVGAGTMGGGIAMNFLNMGLPVTLVEANKEALERGIGVIRRN